MKELSTREYPTRYIARDNPQTWVTNLNPQYSGGFEFAVYHEPMQNQDWPHIQDGIYIEIVSYQGIDFLLSAHACKPDKSREQKALVKRFKTYTGAKRAAIRWLPKAYDFCNS